MKMIFEQTMRLKIKAAIDGQLGGYPKLARITLTPLEWGHLMGELEADTECTNPSPGTHMVIIQGVHIERGNA